MLFAWLLLHRRPRAAALVGATVGLIGVGILLGFDPAGVDGWGVAASLGAMVASSLRVRPDRSVGIGRAGPSDDGMAAARRRDRAGADRGGRRGAAARPHAVVRASGFAYIAIIGTAVAYVAWFTGLRRLPAETVGVIGLLNPVTGVVLGVALAGEAFGLLQAVGVALVLAGVAAGAVVVKKKEADAAPAVHAVPRGRTAVERRRRAVTASVRTSVL